jgi:hypothetical protein
MTESSERSLRAEGRGKRLRFTRRRRLRTGQEATLRSDEHRATGAASSGAAPRRRAPGNRGGEQRGTASRYRAAGLPGATGSEAPADPRGHPNCTRGTIGSEASSNEGTGNRVSVNGARTLSRATGAGSSSGNGGRFADQTGSEGHRYRATGGGAIGKRSRATGGPGPKRASPAMPSGTTGDV